ncbi:hypothetical protein Tco_1050818, partial [Tanacetum coccineum]
LVPQRQKASDYDNPDPAPELQNVSPSVDTTVPSQQELDLLFGPLYDEFFNDGAYRVNKTSDPPIPTGIVYIIRAKHTLEILKKHGMEKGQSIGTPMTTKPKLDADLSGEPVDQTDYHAEHAGCLDTHTSQNHFLEGGNLQFLGDKLVSWMSKKQDCTAMSSAEAEYVALSASCAQVMWMRTQLQDYGFNYNKIPLYCDSQSAIAISCNLLQHITRPKHIHIGIISSKNVENGIIELSLSETRIPIG